MVIEDEPLNAKLITLLLRLEGALVEVARTAEEALPSIQLRRPRLVLLDLILPGMDGLSLVKRVKAADWGGEVTFVAVTALNGPHRAHAAREAGCAGYLCKPLDVDTFAVTIAGFLGRRS